MKAPRSGNLITIRATYRPLSQGFYSFFGPVAYYSLKNKNFSCEYFCDGILSSILFSIVFKRRVGRISFDYSSIAGDFLSDCEERALRVLVVGGTSDDALKFAAHLRTRYPQLSSLCLNGYPKGGYNASTLRRLEYTSSRFDVIVLALGSPLQERVGQHLSDHGFPGVIITAGAFVTQTAAAGANTYYPAIVNKMHIRFLWRLLREPHTRSRFKFVLLFPFSYLKCRFRGDVNFVCK